MARITGIGGVFLARKIQRRWKSGTTEHLGIRLNDYGGRHLSVVRRSPRRHRHDHLVSTFPANTSYFGGRPTGAMINYHPLPASTTSTPCSPSLLPPLAFWIDPKREDASYGPLCLIKDCDGNRPRTVAAPG